MNVSILGGSGYVGGELVRLLLDHPRNPAKHHLRTSRRSISECGPSQPTSSHFSKV